MRPDMDESRISNGNRSIPFFRICALAYLQVVESSPMERKAVQKATLFAHNPMDQAPIKNAHYLRYGADK
eukprot:scaffold323_cov414-Prasinococcus_capsulatus_cf.AAC.16